MNTTAATILVVDDTPANIGVLLEALGSQGYEILVAESGESALSQLAHTRPDLILLDVLMPVMDGYEACRRLKAQPATAHIPVVMVTSLDDQHERVRGLDAGADDFLTKPVQGESIIAVVARAYASYYDVDWDFVGEDLEDIEKSLSRITGREREVLDLVVEGLSSREIGARLGVSTKTVEAHRARINDKMRSDDLPHLIRMMLVFNDDAET